SGGCASTLDNSTNGTTAGAATIPFNTNVTGLISPTGDIDHYKFVITTGGTATVTLTTLPADYDLKILNSAGTQLAISQAGGTSSETISRTYTAGTYYAQVYGYNGANNASTCYTLRVALGTASLVDDVPVVTRSQVFPNPAKNKLTVQLAELNGMADISITDINGRIVMRQRTADNNTEMNISQLSPGVYMVKVMENGKLNNWKFVKE
ncbi:MAG: T9SS type A sorting domain-containing protein, partial [Dinghuibacter sp.]|nr:T9SS type A sorting domain-containing protein [Dinghuibacter sp.]